VTTYATAEAALLTLTRAYSAGACSRPRTAASKTGACSTPPGTDNAAVIEMAGKSIERMTVQAAMATTAHTRKSI
jgi:hypothetical protein